MILLMMILTKASMAIPHQKLVLGEVAPMEVGSFVDINQNADEIPRTSVMIYEDGSKRIYKECDSEEQNKRPSVFSLFQVPFFESTSSVPYVVRTQRVGNELWVISGDALWRSKDGELFERATEQWTMKHQALDPLSIRNLHSLGALFREEIWVDGEKVLLNNPLRLSTDGGQTFKTVHGEKVLRPLMPDPEHNRCHTVRPSRLLRVEDKYPDAAGFLGVRPEETYCFGLHKTNQNKWRIYCLDLVESVQHDPGYQNITRYTIHEANDWLDFIDRWEETRLAEKEQFYAGGRLARCQFKKASVMFSYPDGSGCQRETCMPSWSAIGFWQSDNSYNGHAPPYLTTQRMSRATVPLECGFSDRQWLIPLTCEKQDPYNHRHENLSRFYWVKERYILEPSMKATGDEWFIRGNALRGIWPDDHIILFDSWVKGSWDPKDRVFSFFNHSCGDKYFLTSKGLRAVKGDPTDHSGPKAKVRTVHKGIRKDCFSSRLHVINGVPNRILACEGGEIWVCPNDDCHKAYSVKLIAPFEVQDRRFQVFDTEWFEGHLYFGTSVGLLRAKLEFDETKK